jgi:hypothetical protein
MLQLSVWEWRFNAEYTKRDSRKDSQVKDAMRRTGSVVTVPREGSHKLKKRAAVVCSVCSRRIWFDPVYVTEPEEVPHPRQSWILCRECYQELLIEMRRSPIRSNLRLRIAMGLVAAERWSGAYASSLHSEASDRRWFLFIAIGFFIAMLIHLALIVLVVTIH